MLSMGCFRKKIGNNELRQLVCPLKKRNPKDSIFVSCRVDSLLFAKSSVFTREELHCIIGLCQRHFRYFQALIYQIPRVSEVPAIQSGNLCRLSMILRSVVFNMLQQITANSNALLGQVLSGAYRDFTCVDCEVYTVDENSRFPGFDYIINLCGALFNFANVTENGILCWNIQFTFCVFRPLAIVSQEIHGKDYFDKRKTGHTSGKNCSLKKRRERDILIFYFDFKRRRLLSLLSVLSEGKRLRKPKSWLNSS